VERRQDHDPPPPLLRVPIHGQLRSDCAGRGRRCARRDAPDGRATGDPSTADDLLQEAYYRLLRTTTPFESNDHRRNYLFRIATNLIRDRYRRPRIDNAQIDPELEAGIPSGNDLATQTQQRADLRRAMTRLTPRERELVWLAYGQGSTHQEIAGVLGLKTGSIKPMLFRARRKLARFLRP
jgi:RNA polymerase sigma-70 factor (ECF subfamily)